MNVSEFSKRVGLSAHTIRYYDKIGLLADVHRLSNGHRFFAEKDVVWVEFIQRLKNTGMPISEILQYTRLKKKGKETLADRRFLLERHSQRLESEIQLQQHHMQKLKEKIQLYNSAIKGEITLD